MGQRGNDATRLLLAHKTRTQRAVGTGFHHYVTGSYKLNYLETMTGLKFVMLTDNKSVGDIQKELLYIYSQSVGQMRSFQSQLSPIRCCLLLRVVWCSCAAVILPFDFRSICVAYWVGCMR
jgi:hypothetical protein